jgi:hypothetical protein
MIPRLERRPAALLLGGIVTLALVLRILWLRTDSTFQRTDEVAVVNYLQAAARPNDTVFIWADDPAVDWGARRDPPTRFITLDSLFTGGPHWAGRHPGCPGRPGFAGG